MGFSPSAISQQLATLERETGIALLERSAKRAALTDAGRMLAERAIGVLIAAERTESEVAALARRIGGHVTVSTIPSHASTVAGVLAGLQRVHPDLKVQMRETASLTAPAEVLNLRVDLALVDEWTESPSLPVGLLSIPLNREPVVLAMPSKIKLATDSSITLGEMQRVLEGCTWLCAPPGQPSRLAGDLLLATAGIHPSTRWEFDGLATIAGLVRLGHGAAILPGSVALAANLDPSWSRIMNPAISRQIVALTRSSASQNPTLELLLSSLRDQLRVPTIRAQLYPRSR